MQGFDDARGIPASDGPHRPAWVAHRRHRWYRQLRRRVRSASDGWIQRRADAVVDQVYSRDLPPVVRAELVAIEAARFREALRLPRSGAAIRSAMSTRRCQRMRWRMLPGAEHRHGDSGTVEDDVSASPHRSGKPSVGAHRCRRVR